MTVDTMPRIRVTIDVNDVHKRAFYARANFEGLTPQELFERWVEECAAEEFARAKEMTAADESAEGDEKPMAKERRRPNRKK